MKEVHRLLSIAFFIIPAILAIDIFWKLNTVTEYWLLATSIITSIYFWWGYVFIGEKIHHSQKLIEFVFDIFIFFMIITLFTTIALSSITSWLYIYLFLFFLSIVKYLSIKPNVTNTKIKRFITKKLKTDTLAFVFILIVIFFAISYDYELYAVIALFLMELLHILYVSFIDKIYEI